MLEKVLNSKFLAPVGVIVIIALSYLLLGRYDAKIIQTILENQWNILAFSCYGFSLGIILCQLSVFKTKTEKLHLGLFLFLFLCAILREAGIQHWLASTDSTAFKIHFFKNPDNPLSEKIIAGALLLLVLFVVLYLLKYYFIKIVKGFFKGIPLYWTITTLGCTGILCKIADRLPAHLKKAGFDITDLIKEEIGILEETSEICLCLLCALAFIQYKIVKKHINSIKN